MCEISIAHPTVSYFGTQTGRRLSFSPPFFSPPIALTPPPFNNISHSLEISNPRLAETYTTELNQVLVSNRKASVELHAILLKLDVVERQKGKIALEERQVGMK